MLPLLVLLSALAMPAIAWLSQRGVFGPTNGDVSNAYPTLVVAAGYAFAIWGPIFLLDLAFAAWQLLRAQRDDARLARRRPAIALGFLLTAVWMIAFSQHWFWLALAIIWSALGCMLLATLTLHRTTRWAMPLSLHTGWLCLAAILNTAQVVVAFRLLPTDAMLPWSLPLFALAAALVLGLNLRMRGNWAFAGAAAWALVGVWVKQSDSGLPGAPTAAWTAALAAVLIVAQQAWLAWRGQRSRSSVRASGRPPK